MMHKDAFDAGLATEAPAWEWLGKLARCFPVNHHEPGGYCLLDTSTFDLRRAFEEDPQRVQRFSQTLTDASERPLLHADFSKSHLDERVMQALLQLAEEQRVLALRDAMFEGGAINTTEQRQVMHWLLRAPTQDGLPAPLQDVWREMDAVRSAFLAFAETVRANPAITDVVNIGIGGSDLGPRMAVQALDAFVLPGKRFHFVSNVDGHELKAVLRQVQPRRTLFIIASKTFTTLETMTNAATALQWFREAEGGALADQVQDHFVGITTNLEAAAQLGIRTTFGFWDWVGGRYSVWSAIGLSLAIAIGAEQFRAFLEGAHAVDRHFQTAATEQNLPLRMGLIDVWRSSFLGHAARCMAPYHSGLQALPAYLQQLEMESNGKGVSRDGEHLRYLTAPTVWGEPGTNGQHAFFQLLHQGPHVLPVEFIAVKQADHAWPLHHRLLLANALAQAQALMVGREDEDPQRCCPGNRPSTFLLLEALTPRTLGALLALYEHRVFVAGAVWNINSFDQFGVELGKQLAKDIVPRLESGDVRGLDPSTADLLQRLR
ncbi:MAG: glucose-6-phosphate isomerase [Brachymonas denitrificans]|uniref:glucose-6-phosphate isomerase n=1 Tax=Brachymonas denitrificans TaxID=28220 RepID=UPI00352C515E